MNPQTKEFETWTEYNDWLVLNYNDFCIIELNEVEQKVIAKFVTKEEWEQSKKD